MESLPLEIYYQILLEINIRYISNISRINSKFASISKLDSFYKRKYALDYGNPTELSDGISNEIPTGWRIEYIKEFRKRKLRIWEKLSAKQLIKQAAKCGHYQNFKFAFDYGANIYDVTLTDALEGNNDKIILEVLPRNPELQFSYMIYHNLEISLRYPNTRIQNLLFNKLINNKYIKNNPSDIFSSRCINPLMVSAAKSGNIDIFNYIVDNLNGDNWSTTVEYVIDGNKIAMMRNILNKYYSKIEYIYGTIIEYAGKNGSLEMIHLLLKYTKLTEKKFYNHILIGAARGGHFRLVEYSLDHGATQATEAAIELVRLFPTDILIYTLQLLYKKGANIYLALNNPNIDEIYISYINLYPNLLNSNNTLRLAVHRKDLQLMEKALLLNPTNISSILHNYISEHGDGYPRDTAIIDILIKRDSDLNLSLIKAAEKGNQYFVKRLVEQGANNLNDALLEIYNDCCNYNYVEEGIAEYLVSKGADIGIIYNLLTTQYKFYDKYTIERQPWLLFFKLAEKYKRKDLINNIIQNTKNE